MNRFWSKSARIGVAMLFAVAVGSCGDDDENPVVPDEPGPNAPANVAVTNVNHVEATVSWTDQSDDETGYNVYRKGAQELTETLVFIVASDEASVNAGTYRDIGLAENTQYTYRIEAFNDEGAKSANAVATTGAAPAPYSTICPYAGTGKAYLGEDGLPLLLTDFSLPIDMAVSPSGQAFFLDWNSHRLRASVEGGIMTTVLGTGYIGDGSGSDPSTVALNHPTHVSFDAQGRVLVSAWHNSKIMRLDLAMDQVTTICGTGARAFGGDGGLADTAKLDLPVSTAVAANGDLYILDQANERVRKIDAATGIISTVVGTGQIGFAGDGGPGLQAMMRLPRGQQGNPAARMEIAPNGKLYICDSGNERVREWDPVADIIRTVAGNGTRGGTGDGGPATAASLKQPSDVAFDSAGNMYIADTYNHAIRKVDTNGIITTFAGQIGLPSPPLQPQGNGGSPTQAKLNTPYGVAVDANDNIYITDTLNNSVRVVLK